MDLAEQVRQVANIIDIAAQYTTLKQRGSKHVGLCPFHSEKTPSFTVDSDKQLYHCFGCGAGGDLFTFVMEKEDLSFPEAVKYLAEKYNIPIPEIKKRSPQHLKLEEKLYNITETALAFFRKNLFNTKEGEKALEYLKQRNITENVIQDLKIGYAMNNWDSLLSFFKGKNISQDLLEKAGLILKRQNKEGHYDRFRGRIIFPIFTLSGKAVAFGGRTLFDDDIKYLNSPDTPIYTKGKILYGLNISKETIRNEKDSILVEGYTDFSTLYQTDFRHCVASLGTSVTENQIAVLSRFSSKVIICYDGDEAGKKAAARAVFICKKREVNARVALLSEGMDPDSYIQKFGKDKFKDLLKNSIPGLNFLLHNFTKAKEAKTPEDKARAVKELLTKILANLQDPIVYSETIKEAAKHLVIDEELLRTTIKQKTVNLKTGKKESLLYAEKRLLQIFFENSSITSQIFKDLDLKYFEGLKSEPIFSFLAEFFKRGRSPDFNTLKENIDPSLMTLLSEALIEKGKAPTLEEAEDNLEAIKDFYITRRRKILTPQTTEAEKNKDETKISTLLKQKQDLTEDYTNQNPDN